MLTLNDVRGQMTWKVPEFESFRQIVLTFSTPKATWTLFQIYVSIYWEELELLYIF